MTIVIENSRVTGHEITVGVDRFGCRIRPLVILLEQHRTLDQDLAVIGDPDFDAWRRLADAVKLDLAIGLQADISAGFGLTIELLQIDAD